MSCSITKAALLGLLAAVTASASADELTFVYADPWEHVWTQVIPPGEVNDLEDGFWSISINAVYQGPMGTASVPLFDPSLGTLNHVSRTVAGEADLAATVFYATDSGYGYTLVYHGAPSLGVNIYADPDETLPFDTSWPLAWFLGAAEAGNSLTLVPDIYDITTTPVIASGNTGLAAFSNTSEIYTSLSTFIGPGSYEMNYDSSMGFTAGILGADSGIPSPVVEDDVTGYYNGRLIMAYTFTPDPSTLAVDQDGRPLLEGDVNLDGFVGIADLNIILRNWNLGGRVVGYNEGDIAPVSASGTIGNDFIGIEDMNMVLANWGNGTPPMTTAIPEPTTLALLLGVGTICLKRG